jgi:putative Mg2+ transporter-C (MgtC) family protein
MSTPMIELGLNLVEAVGLGAAIGLERQWRQRLAGLRTNTLVALGAATFIVFSRVLSDDSGVARVGAQVVSGIGFLGAGVIFKEGLNIRGLNTAATLWCSAAVGLLAGAGFPLYGALCAALVVASNVTLRPLVRAINRQPVDASEVELAYVVSLVCRGSNAPEVRSQLVQGLESMPDIQITELDSSAIEDADRVEVTAKIASHKRREIALEYLVARLTREDGVTRELAIAGPVGVMGAGADQRSPTALRFSDSRTRST